MVVSVLVAFLHHSGIGDSVGIVDYTTYNICNVGCCLSELFFGPWQLTAPRGGFAGQALTKSNE